MKHWYALNTKPRKEFQVELGLRQEGIEVYLPTVQRRVRRRDRPDRMIFFPGYLFVRLDFERVPRSTVAWTPGVRSIVSAGDKPTMVAGEIVEMIRRRLEGTEDTDLLVGKRVRIKSGPLRDLEAVFDKPLAARDRVRILLQMLGQTIPVEIDRDQIEPA